MGAPLLHGLSALSPTIAHECEIIPHFLPFVHIFTDPHFLSPLSTFAQLPFAAKTLIKKHQLDAVVCLGTLIKGETHHYEYICEATSHGIMNVGLETVRLRVCSYPPLFVRVRSSCPLLALYLVSHHMLPMCASCHASHGILNVGLETVRLCVRPTTTSTPLRLPQAPQNVTVQVERQ